MTIAAEVASALREAGVATAGAPQIAQLVVREGGPDTPWGEIGAAETPYPLVIVTEAYSQGVVDGTLVRADDLRVMAEATGPVTPSTAHKLRIGGVDHAIVAARPLAPGGVVLMWELQCRR